ncbi:hypothetical protein COV11_00835 [Candidatus Woesearchaeota archaeon CG10_big_fil_rev_8_21_14_0_10_30_7]|nr:MAG: hypothetical protein COV11_00835 [Candidatus Woesearchaeota archaeon CG10_big_fil_rev_8_21_14_0_10_30_7]
MNKLEDAKLVAEEFLRPAELELIKILARDCSDCFDTNSVIESVKKQNVNITKERTLFFDETEAKELIHKYDIQKLPTIIVSGEVNKNDNLKNFFENQGNLLDNVFVFSKQNPPFYDVSKMQVLGRISITHIVDSSCEDCVSLKQVNDFLKQEGAVVSDEKVYEYDSESAKKLLDQFSITKIPAVLISDEINIYPDIAEKLKQIADEKENFYVLQALNAPYNDLNLNKITGLTKLILLSDENCEECYDVQLNEQILLSLGIFVKETTAYDVKSEEGKRLISKYKIEKAPLILVSPEAKSYPVIDQVWKSVGSVEEDGWYVMRKPENLGTYKDIKTGEVIEVE